MIIFKFLILLCLLIQIQIPDLHQHVIRRGKIVFSGVEEQEKDEAEELIEQAREDLEQSADKQGVK